MTHLALSLLGTFQATLDGAPITAFESDNLREAKALLEALSSKPNRIPVA